MFLRGLQSIKDKGVVKDVLIRAGRYSPATYPFGNPISMETCHIPVVASTGYWATKKTDGTRVCLLFCTVGSGATLCKVAVAMDRVGNLFGLKVSCDPHLFAGSIFDAELVQCPGSADFKIQIFDVAMLEGERLDREPLSARLALIEDVFADTVCLLPRVSFETKKMVRLQNLRDLLNEEQPGPGGAPPCVPTDGFILTPEDGPAALPGTAWAVFKIKEHHTVDLLLTDAELWYGSGDELLRVDAFPGYEGRVEVTDDLTKLPDGSIIEFQVGIAAKGLVLTKKCVREDKATPNNAFCLTRTLASIVDSVTIQTLLPSPLQSRRPAAAAAPHSPV